MNNKPLTPTKYRYTLTNTITAETWEFGYIDELEDEMERRIDPWDEADYTIEHDYLDTNLSKPRWFEESPTVTVEEYREAQMIESDRQHAELEKEWAFVA